MDEERGKHLVAICPLVGLFTRRSKQWPARLRTLEAWRSLQMQMTGILDSLITLISSAMPPAGVGHRHRSTARKTHLGPSRPCRPPETIVSNGQPQTKVTSSMMTTRPLPAAPTEMALQPTASASCCSMCFLLRQSEALSSSRSSPNSRLTRPASEVFPMPGGPESSAACPQ